MESLVLSLKYMRIVKNSNYLVEYLPQSQCKDDDLFSSNIEDIIEYKLPEYLDK